MLGEIKGMNIHNCMNENVGSIDGVILTGEHQSSCRKFCPWSFLLNTENFSR